MRYRRRFENSHRCYSDFERHEVESIHDYEIALFLSLVQINHLSYTFQSPSCIYFLFSMVCHCFILNTCSPDPHYYFLCSKCSRSDRRGSATNSLDGQAQLRHGHVDQSSTPDMARQLARFRQLASQLPSKVPAPHAAQLRTQ